MNGRNRKRRSADLRQRGGPDREATSSPPPAAPSIGEAPWFAPALTAAYALVLAFVLWHHELWRDEVQAWMFARDSADPLDLFRNMEYEASPMLWHLLLMPVTRLTSSPAGMQVLHLAIASAVVFVVARYAPFGPLQKALFAFGYFPLYEYGVLSRNYALGLLFVVVTCALLRRRYRRPLWLGVVLALMSHTSAHACILAIGTLFVLALDYGINRRSLAEDDAVDARRIYAGFAVAAIGILLSALQMNPPSDVTQSAGSATWYYSPLLTLNLSWIEKTLKLLPFVVFFPVDPRFAPVVGLAPEQPEVVYGALTAVALAAVVVAFHWRRPVALLLFLCPAAGLLIFFYAIHVGSFRHHGFLLIALLALVWGGRYLGGSAAGREGRRAVAARRAGSVLLTGLLAMHAFGGLRAAAIEVERPFSQGKRTAEYIRANGLEELPMIGYPDWSASAVLGHLRPDKRIHYVQGNREGSFVVYDGARRGAGPRGSVYISSLMAQTRALAARNDGKALMILAGKLEIPPGERHLRPLASFTGAIADDENFWLYLYQARADQGRARE